MGDVCGSKIKGIQGHMAACGDEDVRAGDGGAIFQAGANFARSADQAGYGRAFQDCDTFGAQRSKHHPGKFRIIFTKRMHALDDSYHTAQASMGLRHFDTNRAAADDDKMARLFAQGKDRFVGQVGHGFHARNGRDQRPRPCGNDKAASADDGTPRLQVGGGYESAVCADDVHAKAFKPGLAIHRGNGFDHAGYMIFDGSEIYLWGDRCYAKRRACGHRMGMVGGGYQGFRRHAAHIQAITAHFTAFHQHHARTHLRCRRRDRQAARACADDAQIGGNVGGGHG